MRLVHVLLGLFGRETVKHISFSQEFQAGHKSRAGLQRLAGSTGSEAVFLLLFGIEWNTHLGMDKWKKKNKRGLKSLDNLEWYGYVWKLE